MYMFSAVICNLLGFNLIQFNFKLYQTLNISFLQVHAFKGRDRLDMVVELKVQYCKEKLQDSFDTNETFLRCTILKKGLKSFVSVVSVNRRKFFLQLLNLLHLKQSHLRNSIFLTKKGGGLHETLLRLRQSVGEVYQTNRSLRTSRCCFFTTFKGYFKNRLLKT